MGVATVGVVFASVRRWFSAGAGLIAGAVVAVTPVAALMFRFNNPDALARPAADGRRLRRAAGGRDGQPAVDGAGRRARRLRVPHQDAAGVHRAARLRPRVPAGGAGVVLAARLAHHRPRPHHASPRARWWVAIVELWPASSRPYIGGSQHNSVLELVFGYNGFGRLTGNESGSVGGGPADAGGRWGPTGWLRMFNDSFGGQISWLMPAALLLLVAGLVWTLRRPRTDRTRAALAAVGRLAGHHRRSCSASVRASSTSTTRSRWPRRSARSSASAPPSCGSSGPRSGAASSWPPPSW